MIQSEYLMVTAFRAISDYDGALNWFDVSPPPSFLGHHWIKVQVVYGMFSIFNLVYITINFMIMRPKGYT